MITENQRYSEVPNPPTILPFYVPPKDISGRGKEIPAVDLWPDYVHSWPRALLEQPQSQSQQRFYFQLAGTIETAECWRHQGSEYVALLRTLMSYLALRDDWDGYGGRAATWKAVSDAIVFLARLPRTLPLPRPMVAGSSIVGLYWERGHLYASIDFDGSGMFCYITDRAGNAQGEENVKVDEGSLPSGLTEMLREIADAVG